MKDQELRDRFHAYRPQIDDNDVFMAQLMAQMDAVDAQQPLNLGSPGRQEARIIPLYRRILPWVAGVAAVVVVAVFVIKEPVTSSTDTSYESRLPEYYHKAPSPIPEQSLPTRSLSDFSSYEDVVNEIEQSGRQLENAIAQL